MAEEEKKHVRRKRYRGNHPRSFSEKYKEHDPERYAQDIERVLARGDTPAGSHRSIAVKEVLEALAPKPGQTALDLTLGYGGHAKEILGAIQPGGRLIGLDQDAEELGRTTLRLAALGYGPEAFLPVHSNFSGLVPWLEATGTGKVDLILADLGLSSMQLDDPGRGFSYKRRGPLDMRMDRSEGPSARDFLAEASEEKLCAILIANADADEAMAQGIARALHDRRGHLATTRDLAEAICSVFPDKAFKEPDMARILRRSFQAIRIEVNHEFQALETLLKALPSCLQDGGRLAILSFHSGEDGRVEGALQEGLSTGLYSSISAEAGRVAREERHANPRSSSAKLRWAIRA